MPLVDRLREPCLDFSGEMIVRESTPRYEIHCDLLYDAAAEIERLTRERDELIHLMSEVDAGNRIVDQRAESAEADLARAREALETIEGATNADDPESYRSDDREGCLDTVHSIARALLHPNSGDAE